MSIRSFGRKIIGRYLPEKWSAAIFAQWRLWRYRYRKTLNTIEFHVSEHCNLNCAGCDHFSPLAQEEYANLEVVKKDLAQLATLCRGGRYNIKEIRLIGGEPLLHKDIAFFFPVVRKHFPQSNINVFTNGILLAKQPDIFWQACKDSAVGLLVTRYPIKIDIETIKEKSEQYDVKFMYADGIRNEEMYRCVLSLSGKGNVKKNWKYCYHNQWPFIRNGRIYPCPFYANIRHFNQYFNMNLPLTDKDSIDIHTKKSFKAIIRFLAKPIPACRYCDIPSYTYGHKWEISKKDIKEWT
jgi:MoaA/NifB/PqqE/SkfB family radical SAM enzyme